MIKVVENCDEYIDKLLAIHKNNIPQNDQMTDSAFLDEFRQDSRTYFVAIHDNIPVGYIGLFDCDEDFNIIGIAVEKEYQRQGIGTRLLDKAICYAKENGKKSLSLEVDENNISAISFYEKQGFETISMRKHYYKDNDALIMFLYL